MQYRPALHLLTLLLLLSGTLPLTPLARPALAQPGCQTFPQTGHTLCGRFLEYWDGHGGLAQQGYPITEELTDQSDLNGQTYTVQYFERAVFEKHPENQPPFDVLLAQLGKFRYDDKYPTGAPNQHVSTDNPRQFAATGHTVGGLFRTYWESHGGLAQQGLPISDEMQEKSATDGKTYTVQYFERAVFEYHPENAGTAYEVLLSLLGQPYLYRKGRAVIYGTAGSGGVICRPSAGINISALTCARTVAPSPTGFRAVDNADPIRPALAYGGDVLRADSSGTVVAHVPPGWLRLITGAGVVLRATTNSNSGGGLARCTAKNAADIASLIQQDGIVLYNHTQGGFSVDSGHYCTQALDTKFSIRVYPDRSVKIAVWEGSKGVVISSARDQTVQLKPGMQIHGSAEGQLDSVPEPLDGETTDLWLLYGNGETLAIKGDSDPFALDKCDPSLKNELYPAMPQEVAARLGCPQATSHVYDNSHPGPITYTNDNNNSTNGTLFDDNQQKTVYVVRAAKSEIDYVWEAYSSVGNVPDLRKLHPTLDAELGTGNLTCPQDQWAVQRFAGGRVLRIPGPRINLYSCSSQSVTSVLVLYDDGSAQVR
ncbi:MAG: hypothetical protein M3Z04_25690 [Chloroflexota bacterium]|nr:hypothetical protein [Chloroflexota bacterium]